MMQSVLIHLESYRQVTKDATSFYIIGAKNFPSVNFIIVGILPVSILLAGFLVQFFHFTCQMF